MIRKAVLTAACLAVIALNAVVGGGATAKACPFTHQGHLGERSRHGVMQFSGEHLALQLGFGGVRPAQRGGVAV